MIILVGDINTCEDIILLASIGSLLLHHGQQQVISIKDIDRMHLQPGDKVLWLEAHGEAGYLVDGTTHIPAVPICASSKSFKDYVISIGVENAKNIQTMQILACHSGEAAQLSGATESVSLVDGAIQGLEQMGIGGTEVVGYNGLFIADPKNGIFYVVGSKDTLQEERLESSLWSKLNVDAEFQNFRVSLNGLSFEEKAKKVAQWDIYNKFMVALITQLKSAGILLSTGEVTTKVSSIKAPTQGMTSLSSSQSPTTPLAPQSSSTTPQQQQLSSPQQLSVAAKTQVEILSILQSTSIPTKVTFKPAAIPQQQSPSTPAPDMAAAQQQQQHSEPPPSSTSPPI